MRAPKVNGHVCLTVRDSSSAARRMRRLSDAVWWPLHHSCTLRDNMLRIFAPGDTRTTRSMIVEHRNTTSGNNASCFVLEISTKSLILF
jgi:hypothetical protein